MILCMATQDLCPAHNIQSIHGFTVTDRDQYPCNDLNTAATKSNPITVENAIPQMNQTGWGIDLTRGM